MQIRALLQCSGWWKCTWSCAATHKKWQKNNFCAVARLLIMLMHKLTQTHVGIVWTDCRQTDDFCNLLSLTLLLHDSYLFSCYHRRQTQRVWFRKPLTDMQYLHLGGVKIRWTYLYFFNNCLVWAIGFSLSPVFLFSYAAVKFAYDTWSG